MRYRLCKYCGDLHQIGAWPHNCRDDPPPRGAYPAPYVQSDAMPGGINGVFSHADCKRYDSKSRYREALRDAGCVELGTEKYHTAFSDKPMKKIEESVNEALQQYEAETGYAPRPD